MRSLVLAGLCLIGAASICSIGSLIDSHTHASVAWALGACTAFAGAAAGYGATAGAARRAVPAIALALMGVVGSLWIVAATLSFATPRMMVAGGLVDRALQFLAVFASGAGLALLAAAAWRAGLLLPVVGKVLAVVALLGALTADPAVPYLVGAAPLGVALLVAGARARAGGVRAVDATRAPGGGDRVSRSDAFERRRRTKPTSCSAAFGADVAFAVRVGGAR